jgi:hypothetical protein
LKGKVAAPVQEAENTATGICCTGHVAHLSARVGTNFADKGWSLGWHSSLTECLFLITTSLLTRYICGGRGKSRFPLGSQKGIGRDCSTTESPSCR